MKDFSLFYGPARAWLPVVAIAALGAFIFFSQADRGLEPAGPGTTGDQQGQLAEPIGNVAVTGAGQSPIVGSGRSAGGIIDAVGADTGSDADSGPVPFVSLQPSPEPMTEAGEELVRSLTTDGVGDG